MTLGGLIRVSDRWAGLWVSSLKRDVDMRHGAGKESGGHQSYSSAYSEENDSMILEENSNDVLEY